MILKAYNNYILIAVVVIASSVPHFLNHIQYGNELSKLVYMVIVYYIARTVCSYLSEKICISFYYQSLQAKRY